MIDGWDERDELRSRLRAERWEEAKANPKPGTWRVYCATCLETTHVGQLVVVEGCSTLINGFPSCRCYAAGGRGVPVLEALGLGDSTLLQTPT